MFSTYATILFLVATVASQEAREVDRGWFGIGNANVTALDNWTLELIEHARIQPNKTRSVKFNPFDAESMQQFDSELERVNWHWRVNVSDFGLPHARLAEKPDTVPHMVVTTHDFTWPSGGNISSQLNGSFPFCVATQFTYEGLARNVTNAFTEEVADDTSCVPVLGNDCVSAIVNEQILVNGSCSYSETSWARIPACSGSFGYSSEERNPSGLLRAKANLNGPADSRSTIISWQYSSGDQFLFTTTGIYDPEAKDAGRVFRNESRALQVILMRTLLPTDDTRQTAKLVCMRVDTEDMEGSATRRFPGFGALEWILLAGALFFVTH